MTQLPSTSWTAFKGDRQLASGPLIEVVLAVKRESDSSATEPILVFDDSNGRVRDFDLRGTRAQIVARLSQSFPAAPRGRGRPRLGVVGREVTLLPRHWEWLANQPGGASVVLRRLVDEARRTSGDRDRMRAAREAAYRVMSAMAGNLPGFEEATRALFANDRDRFEQHIADWPEDVRLYASRLAFVEQADPSG